MITDEQKREIGRLIEFEFEKLGSWKKVAGRVGVNPNTVRYNMTQPDKWYNVSDKMWVSVGGTLGYRFNETPWRLVPTTNTKIMFEYLERAQNEQVFMAISHNAGHGKTAGVRMYRDQKQGVYYLSCEESWSHKQFMMKVAEVMGLTRGVTSLRYSVAGLTDMIVHEFKQQAITTRPLLIIDEANKMKPSSLRFFIPLFNHLKYEIGKVLIGAHDLREHIRNGVRRDARGFDELESRLGRAYMPLAGIFEQDVRAICDANGLTDPIAQERVWNRLKPERVEFGGKYEWMAGQDLRVLKQAVKFELERLRIAANVSVSQSVNNASQMATA